MTTTEQTVSAEEIRRMTTRLTQMGQEFMPVLRGAVVLKGEAEASTLDEEAASELAELIGQVKAVFDLARLAYEGGAGGFRMLDAVDDREPQAAPADLELFGVTVPGALMQRSTVLTRRINALNDHLAPIVTEAHDVAYELSELGRDIHERAIGLVVSEERQRDVADSLDEYLGTVTTVLDLWAALSSLSTESDPDSAIEIKRDVARMVAEHAARQSPAPE